ncbi:hypothetical protein ES702_07022 [subsurface metagenome]
MVRDGLDCGGRGLRGNCDNILRMIGTERYVNVFQDFVEYLHSVCRDIDFWVKNRYSTNKVIKDDIA